MLGIIVPYRNREEHLNQFLPYMREYLAKCNIPHKFYIVEQADDKPFNRGKLLNIGFTFAEKECSYVALHDVDMLPVMADYSKPYDCEQLATQVEQFNYKMPHPFYFGGVTLFTCSLFNTINGFHNEYWGWGGEDDELRRRVIRNAIPITRSAGRFRSLPHPKSYHKPYLTDGPSLAILKAPIDFSNGLSSLQYELVSKEEKEDVVFIKAKL